MKIAILYHGNNIIFIRSFDKINEIRDYLDIRKSMKVSCSLSIQDLDTDKECQIDNSAFDAFLEGDSMLLLYDIHKKF